MMQISYSGKDNISVEEVEEMKQRWCNKLGLFKEEFDNHNGFVHIHLNKEENSPDYYSFSLPEPYNLSEFIQRFNEYVRALPQ